MKKPALLVVTALSLASIEPTMALEHILIPRVTGSGDIRLSDDLKIGRYQDGKFISQPDAVEIQGSGSTGPVDGMNVAGNLLSALFANRSVTPQMYGANGLGNTDDTAAVRSALQSGRPFECHGTFKITAPIIVDQPLGRSLAMRGSVRQGCKFLLSGTGRFQFNLSIPVGGTDPNRYNYLPQIVLQDFTVAPTSVLQDGASNYAVAAISVVGPSAASGNIGGWTTSMLSVRNVVVAADDSLSAYTRHGLYLDNVQSPLVQEFTCVGGRGVFYSPASTCITYTGDGLPVDAGFRHVRAYNVETGIRLAGTWQGVVIDDLVVVNAAVGVDAGSTDDNSLLLKVINSELNVTNYPVQASNITHVMVYDNHLNLNGPHNGSSPACVSLAMTGAATPRFIVHDNVCEGFQRQVSGGAKRYGVTVNTPLALTAQHTNGNIHDNQFSQIDVGIYLGPSVNSVDVGCNQYVADSGLPIVAVQNDNPGTIAAFVNYRTCTASPLSSGASAGR